MKYRKKPIEVEAFQLGIDYIPDWFMDKVTTNDIVLHGKSSGFEHQNDINADIKTLEGIMHANFGDFIIRGVNGEIYPCKPDIFEKTYEEAGKQSDRKEFFLMCQRASLFDLKEVPEEYIVISDGIKYIPIGYELTFKRGEPEHKAILQDRKASSTTRARLEGVKRI